MSHVAVDGGIHRGLKLGVKEVREVCGGMEKKVFNPLAKDIYI